MKRIVLIDGENLVYGLRHLLGKSGSKASRSSIDNFNFRGLIEELLADDLPSEILWFGARLRLYDQTEEIKRKSSEAIKSQAKFMKESATELAQKNIRVNAIAPGPVVDSDRPEPSKYVPLGFTLQPKDVAYSLLFLVSESARYITGQTLVVDGGFSLTDTHYWIKKKEL